MAGLSAGVVAAAGAGLVSATPVRPVQDLARMLIEVPDQAGDQVANLGDRELGQLAAQVGDPLFSPLMAARVTVR
jgi:hypothetical protein